MTHTQIRAEVPDSVAVSTPLGGTGDSGLRGVGRRVLASLLRARKALLIHIALRATGLAVMAVWAERKDVRPLEILGGRWDAVYYLHMAQNGLTTPMPNPSPCGFAGPDCQLAFFPVYPMLIRYTSYVTGLPMNWVAMGLALLASVVAAWGIFAVTDRIYGRRVALFTCALFAIVPAALVQSMAYTEPLFLALAVWAMYAVMTRSWLTAGVLAFVAGATRPSGSAIVAAVVLAGVWEYVQWLRKRRAKRPPVGRIVAASLIAPLGWFGYVGYVGWYFGQWDGYFELQRRWGSVFDGGFDTLVGLKKTFTEVQTTLNHVVVSLTVVTAVVLFVLMTRKHRPPMVVWIYTAMILLISLGGGGEYYFSKMRFIMLAFPLLFPFALALARARRATVLWIVGPTAVVSALFGGNLSFVWWGSP
ncbi:MULTISPECIES: glycosyltransferase family 39 protein [unclassified Streptomyces]|uniref:glycosyltransferase family 39 protein n=1 Tax=unclassified Streptomyces TaxID=2593676 RepID=UPI0029AF6902|nr:glycosyltransferase family 39 protein [Streptomyces sp. DK15]MDX2394011.1 glycosyltransferase family 39 protein [Streptomyces sp. DK15]